jgi:hypothetical protein
MIPKLAIRVVQSAAFTLLCAAPSARAQLFVDNGGPRDIFFDSTADKDSVNGLLSKIDTGDKSASFSYYGRPFAGQPFILGGKAKLTASDGLDEFFRFQRFPQTDLSLLGNWSGMWRSGSHTYLWSLTPNLTGTYADYALIDPASTAVPKQITKESRLAGAFNNTFSIVFPWGDAAAFSAGVKRDNNYSSLPEVTITTTGGKLPDGTAVAGLAGTTSARLGIFQENTSYPLYLTYSHVFAAQWIAHVIPGIDQSSAYDLIAAPYGKWTPKSGAGTARSFGINLTIRALSNSVLGSNGERELAKDKKPNDQKLSFPYAVYVEHSTDQNGVSKTTSGVAVIFKWQ